MANPGTNVFLLGLLAVAYILLTIQKRNGVWWVFAVLFLLTAASIRHSIDIRLVKDFPPYFDSFLQVKSGTIPSNILFEPYRLILFKVVLLFGYLVGGLDDLTLINIVYYYHFVVVTGFFLWLAYSRELTFELKLVLFLGFYPVMAFVWIRGGMAVVASCFLFFKVATGRFRVLHFLLPLIHASVIPLLLTMKIKDLNPVRKGLIMVFAAGVGYFVLDSSYVQYIMYKWDYYAGTAEERTSISLLLFHVANVLVFSYLALINSKFRKNFAVLTLMGTDIALYLVSPVMALRIFPFVLVACIVQRIPFPRYQLLTMLVCAAYLPIYFARFDQIFR